MNFIKLLSAYMLFNILFINCAIAGDSYVSGFGMISGDIKYKSYKCNDEFPLEVTFNNNTIRTIGNISFKIIARIPGRSSDLLDGFRLDNNGKIIDSGYRNSDKIINRFDEGGLCYRMPELSRDINPVDLEWDIKINNVEWN